MCGNALFIITLFIIADDDDCCRRTLNVPTSSHKRRKLTCASAECARDTCVGKRRWAIDGGARCLRAPALALVACCYRRRCGCCCCCVVRAVVVVVVVHCRCVCCERAERTLRFRLAARPLDARRPHRCASVCLLLLRLITRSILRRATVVRCCTNDAASVALLPRAQPVAK